MSSKKYYNETGQTVAAVTTDDQGHIFELQAMLPLALIELINQVKKHEVVTFITEYTSVPVDLLKAYGKEPLVFLAYMTERGLIVNVKRPHKEDAPAFRIEHHRDGVTRVVAMNTSARDFFVSLCGRGARALIRIVQDHLSRTILQTEWRSSTCNEAERYSVTFELPDGTLEARTQLTREELMTIMCDNTITKITVTPEEDTNG